MFERVAHLTEEAVHLASWDLTPRQVCDLEVLLSGACAPLQGYLGQADYGRCTDDMRLADGTLWPLPLVLDVTKAFAESLSGGDRIALRHPEGMVLAILEVSDVWTPDRMAEAASVLGTTDETHPGVFALNHATNPIYVGGRLQGLALPPHHTYPELRHTPEELAREFQERGWERIVGFQTRNPLHRAHVELVKRAAAELDAGVLLHPVVGRTSPGDVDYFTRVRCYQAVLPYLPQRTILSLLPIAMRMAGPREALWHAILRKNCGCTHFIVGRDHASPPGSLYDPYAAQDLVRQHQAEIGIAMVPFEEIVYCEATQRYRPRSEAGASARTLSGKELRQLLRDGLPIPDWASFPEVIAALRKTYSPRTEQGITIFFTGLSGSGKSTVANVLVAKLMEIGTRPVTLLDGDIVRKNLSSELGFSKEHRDLNVRRIGFVASEITKNRGMAVCAPIAPYRAVRREVRELITAHGGFMEVYVSTSLEVCMDRDPKGMYAKAKAGLIKGFTGIDDPYEVPERPDVEIDTARLNPEKAAESILEWLRHKGYIATA